MESQEILGAIAQPKRVMGSMRLEMATVGPRVVSSPRKAIAKLKIQNVTPTYVFEVAELNGTMMRLYVRVTPNRKLRQ